MGKKKKFPIIPVLIIIAIAVVAYGGTQGWFKSVFIFPETPNAPLNPPNQYYLYNLYLNIAPSTICVGDSATGSITSNIPNGICSIWYNPNSAGWGLYSNVNLNSAGSYSETNTLTAAGNVIFRAICCDANGNCKVSVDKTLVVNTCPSAPKWLCCSGYGYFDCFQDTCPLGWTKINQFTSESSCNAGCSSPPSEPSGTYTCGQGSDTQCGGTCPSGYSCAAIESDTAQWCACIIGGNEGAVHPNWKPDGIYYNPIGGDSACTESESHAIAINFVNNWFAFAKAQDSSCHPICSVAMGFSNGWLFDCQYLCSVLGTYYLDVNVINCVASTA